MKILKNHDDANTTMTRLLRRIQRVAPFSIVLVFFWAAAAQAQTNKQITYSVAIPVDRAAASSAPAEIRSAPEPVIRPIDQAATPPVVKSSPEKAKDSSSKKKVDKKKLAVAQTASSKAAATKASKEKAKKTSTNKQVATRTLKKNSSSAAYKSPEDAAKLAGKTAPPTQVTLKSMTVGSDVDVGKLASTLGTSSSESSSVEAPNISDFVVQTDVSDEEARLAESSEYDDEDLSPDAKSINLSAVEPTPIIANNSPLMISDERENFVNEFQAYVEAKIVPRVPGAALAIITDGKIKVLQAYGVKKIGENDLIDTHTAFRLASVSKTIAGTAAGVLVRDGYVFWDTTISTVLPNVEFSNPRYGNQITLRNILSQSSGLPAHSGDNLIENGSSFEEVVQKLKTINFVCPPGKCYAYQNVMLSLLSDIVTAKTGKTYEQFVKEKIFAPLGMRSASIGMEGLFATNNYAIPHEVNSRGKWYTKEIAQNYYRLNPAAGANASIDDMSRWVLAQLGRNPDVLSLDLLETIHAKVTKTTPSQSHYGAKNGVTDTHYGMGWRTFDYRGDSNFVHHGGYVFGSRSEMVFNKELQIGMVMLSNCNRLPGDIIFKFLDAYEDQKRGVRKLAMAPIRRKK